MTAVARPAQDGFFRLQASGYRKNGLASSILCFPNLRLWTLDFGPQQLPPPLIHQRLDEIELPHLPAGDVKEPDRDLNGFQRLAGNAGIRRQCHPAATVRPEWWR